MKNVNNKKTDRKYKSERQSFELFSSLQPSIIHFSTNNQKNKQTNTTTTKRTNGKGSKRKEAKENEQTHGQKKQGENKMNK